MSGWSTLRWGAVRVAGLPASTAQELACTRLDAAYGVIRDARQTEHDARGDLAAAIHARIAAGGLHKASRNRLLTVRRAALGDRPLPGFAPAVVEPDLIARHRRARAAGENVEKAEAGFAALADREVSLVRASLGKLASDRLMQEGLTISNARLARFCLGLCGAAVCPTGKKADRNFAALWSYAMRAATRPTPLGTFAFCGLLDWDRPVRNVSETNIGPLRRRVTIALGALARCRQGADGRRLSGAPAELAALDPEGDDRVAGLVRSLTTFPKAAPAARLATLDRLKTHLDLDNAVHPLVFEDVLLDPADGPPPPLPAPRILDHLEPVLKLTEASMSTMAHLRMCEAFFERFGVDGCCEDVPGFLREVENLPGFVDRIRFATLPPAWLESPIAAAASRLDVDEVDCPVEWFDALGTYAYDADIAVFFSISGGRLVLNGVQSGRGKYLSRFLDRCDPLDRAALAGVRADLAAGAALPVEIGVTLGLNFQVHPPLTRHAFAGTTQDGQDAVALEDLRLSFDVAGRRLRLCLSGSGQEIEPVHLGFLRDVNLPDQWLQLRALSPRLADDTVAERIRIHDTLDQRTLATGGALPRRRPRLVVGNVVLEPARWYFRASELPQFESGQGADAQLRLTVEWLDRTGAPAACWLDVVDQTGGSSGPRRFDWTSPWAARVLRSHVRRWATLDPNTLWVVLREVLPEDPVLSDGFGAPVAAEWMMQLRRTPETPRPGRGAQ